MKTIKILTLMLLMILSTPCHAAICTFTLVNPVNFGNYNPFSSASDDSVGSLRLLCVGAPSPTGYTLTLGSGNSGKFTARYLSNGAEHLNYNLYKDAAMTQIWGDTGSSVAVINDNGNIVRNVYGRIPAGQDVAVGSYNDTILVTINF